jgi:hypothetical protein
MRKLLVLLLVLMSATCFGATRQKTWVTGDSLTANDLNADWDNFYSEKITASNIANGAVGNNQLGTITGSGKINFSALTVAGQAQGDIIYHNGTNWARLGAGTAGQALVTGGAAANPAWGGLDFGAWDAGAPWVLDTIYHSTEAGFLVVETAGVGGATNTVLTDSVTPPTVQRGAVMNTVAAVMTIPVISGDYWEVTGAAVTSLYWIPLN